MRCTCCPYGYHLDTDFMKFLDEMYGPDVLHTLQRIERKRHDVRSRLIHDQQQQVGKPGLNNLGENKKKRKKGIIYAKSNQICDPELIWNQIFSSLFFFFESKEERQKILRIVSFLEKKSKEKRRCSSMLIIVWVLLFTIRSIRSLHLPIVWRRITSMIAVWVTLTKQIIASSV